MPQTIYFGRFISTPTPDDLLVRTGAVLVSSNDGHGTITKTDWTVNGANDALSKFGVEVPVVTCPDDGFFFPGFIDTHIHASQYPNAGIFGKSTLLDWLTTYTFPLESSLGSEDSPMYTSSTSTSSPSSPKPNPLARAQKVYARLIASTLSHGTTTAAYYATLSLPATNTLATIAHKRGQRAYIGRVCMDNPTTCPDYYRDDSTATTLAHTHASISYCKSLDPTGDLVAPILTPRFAPSCLPETLSALGSLAREEGIRVQTHISENVSEIALVKELFPGQDSYAAVYDAHGLLGEKTVLAHAVHLTDGETELVRERKAKVSHCPASNSALGSGFCNVRKLRERGVDVGLGTDVSGGYSVSVLEAVRQACLVSRHVGFLNGGDSRFNVGVAEGLWLATVGGAKVLGLEGRSGGFEEGMWWDVQEVGLGSVPDKEGEEEGKESNTIDRADGNVDIFGWENWEERVAKWVWNGDDRNIRRVWVGGRLTHERK